MTSAVASSAAAERASPPSSGGALETMTRAPSLRNGAAAPQHRHGQRKLLKGLVRHQHDLFISSSCFLAVQQRGGLLDQPRLEHRVPGPPPRLAPVSRSEVPEGRLHDPQLPARPLGVKIFRDLGYCCGAFAAVGGDLDDGADAELVRLRERGREEEERKKTLSFFSFFFVRLGCSSSIALIALSSFLSFSSHCAWSTPGRAGGSRGEGSR